MASDVKNDWHKFLNEYKGRGLSIYELSYVYRKSKRKSSSKLLFTQDQFYALLARLDRLENSLELLIDKVIDEVNNGNKPKDLPLNEFFSTFCALKAWDENYPSAKGYKSSLDWFIKFLKERYPKVRSLRELTPIMISEYIKFHRGRHIFSKKRNQWEKLSERTVNARARARSFMSLVMHMLPESLPSMDFSQ